MADFEIDIVLDPNVAPGKAVVDRALTDMQAHGERAARGINAAFEQMSTVVSAKMSGIGAAMARALDSANFSQAFKRLGAGPSDFADNLLSLDGPVTDMFDGWKKGAHTATGATDALGEAANVLTGGLTRLGVAGAAVFAAKKVIDYADGYTQLQNRLRGVTDSSDELADVTAKLFDVADETRSAIGPTSEFYARLARNADDLGLSQQGMLDVTETLGKALKLSGGSASESSAAMIQLSQALGSGVLRGDEFNSIMENAGILAEGLADSLGVPKSQLRAMAEAGQISADVVIKAIQGMKGQVDAEFAETAPTFADVMTQIENRLVKFGGQIGPALAPIMSTFGALVDVAFDALGALGPVFEVIGAGLSAAAELGEPIIAAIGKAIELAAKLLGVVADVVDALGGVRESLSDALGGDVGDKLDKIQAHVVGVRDSIAQDLSQTLVQGLKNTQNAINATAFAMGNFAALTADARIREIVSDFEALGELRRKLDPTIEATEQMDAVTRALAQELKEGKISAAEFGIELSRMRGELFGASDAADLLVDAVERINDAIAKKQKEAAKEAADEFKKFKEEVRGLVEAANPAIAAVREYTEASVAMERALRRGLVTEQEAVAVLRQKELAMRDLAEVVFNEGIGFEPGTQNEQARFDQVFSDRSKAEADAQALAVEEQAARIGRAMDAAREAQERFERSTLDGGLQAGLVGIGESLRSVGDDARNLVTQGFDLMTDAIIDSALQGELSFGRFADFIEEQVPRILLKLALLKGFEFAAGGGLGSGGVAFAKFFGFAEGGSVGGSIFPQIPGASGADSRLAAFRVSPDERVDILTPSQQRAQADAIAGGGRAGGDLRVKVVNVTDPREALDVVDSPAGERVVMNILKRNRSAAKRLLS